MRDLSMLRLCLLAALALLAAAASAPSCRTRPGGPLRRRPAHNGMGGHVGPPLRNGTASGRPPHPTLSLGGERENNGTANTEYPARNNQ